MNAYTTADAITDSLLIYGVVIVVSMAVAAVIRGIVWALARRPTPAPVRAPAVPASPVTADGVPPEHVVAIAAALARVLGEHRIVRIGPPVQGRDWAAGSRSAHHGSHAPHKP